MKEIIKPRGGRAGIICWRRLSLNSLFAQACGRLQEGEAALLNDDRVGRALDRLLDADRSALLTELVLTAVREFRIALDQLHNDSTTLTPTETYRSADGREVRGQPTGEFTYGHNKDHRPDLQQLQLVLTISKDGAVPVHYSALAGNTSDATTHIATWEMMIADGRSDGMFPLITNCRDLSAAAILAAGKFQPCPEKRHEQLKAVQDLAPVWVKNVSRIEALLFRYFIALLECGK